MILSVVWLALMIVFLIVEAISLGLTSIWFAGGALAAALVSLFCPNVWIPMIVFIVVSGLLLYFTRPWAQKHFTKDRSKTNVEGVIGKIGIVTEEINNIASTGTIVIAGQEWRRDQTKRN